MSLKTGWLKLSGTVDYFWSGFKTSPAATTIWSPIFGAIAGTVMSIGLLIADEAGVKSFSDDADRDVEMFEGGVAMAFPDNCDLGTDFYLISNKKGGGLEIGRGYHSYSRVLPIETQEKITDDISDCMDDMADWVKKDRLQFTEEFRYQAGLTYSEAGIVFDHTDGETLLSKDIIEEKSDKPAHLKAVVEALDSYVEDSDNTRLFKAEFAKAQDSWNEYKSKRNSRDPYFTRDNELKNVDSYAQYEYSSVGLELWGGLVGGSTLAIFLFNCGPGTGYRGGGYDRREEEREEKIKAVKALAKHKPLDF
tara:strand:- start:89424 stop:90344 length:921 start_codon:yes stop_codon:yes gene_type:complete